MLKEQFLAFLRLLFGQELTNNKNKKHYDKENPTPWIR